MAGEGLFLGLLIAAIIAILVYYDAKQRNLINNPWIKTASGWAIGVFFLLIIFLPVYFVTRGPTKRELYVFQKKQCIICDITIDMFEDVCPYCGGKQPPI